MPLCLHMCLSFSLFTLQTAISHTKTLLFTKPGQVRDRDGDVEEDECEMVESQIG